MINFKSFIKSTALAFTILAAILGIAKLLDHQYPSSILNHPYFILRGFGNYHDIITNGYLRFFTQVQYYGPCGFFFLTFFIYRLASKSFRKEDAYFYTLIWILLFLTAYRGFQNPRYFATFMLPVIFIVIKELRHLTFYRLVLIASMLLLIASTQTHYSSLQKISTSVYKIFDPTVLIRGLEGNVLILNSPELFYHIGSKNLISYPIVRGKDRSIDEAKLFLKENSIRYVFTAEKLSKYHSWENIIKASHSEAFKITSYGQFKLIEISSP